MVLRLKNKSLDTESIVTLLGNILVPENDITDVPSYFTERQVREAIVFFPNLVLLGGYVVNADDIEYGNILNYAGVMTKDVYDTNFNNIVDTTEGGGVPPGTPSYITVAFDFNDFVAGFKNIGNILANVSIENTSIEVIDAFDTGSISIGDDLDNSRLASTATNNLEYVGTYDVTNSYTYLNSTLVKMFTNGLPITGSGNIIIYFS